MSAYPRPIVARLRSTLLLAALVGLFAHGAPAAAEPGVSPVVAVRSSHLFLVVLENREFDEVVGSPQAPYLNHLAGRGALAIDYFAVTHPSLPNYLALLGGNTFGIAENCTECLVAGPNLATQLSRAGISWRAYVQGLPYPCFTGTTPAPYAKRHNPFVYFPSITAVPGRCRNVMPEPQLPLDLAAGRLPTFGWLIPDLCHDGHDCGLAHADHYLSTLLPGVVRQLGPHGMLVVTFDEGTGDGGCCGSPGGGRVATILVGPGIPRGSETLQPANHYSLLASIEDRFGLPRLRLARSVHPFAPALFGPTD